MNTRRLFNLALVAGLMVAVSSPAFATDATDAGSNLVATLQDLITGNLGLLLGLGITILGIWTWIIKQEAAAGITMIVGGVLLTVAPGLFNSFRSLVDGAVGAAGDDLQQVKPNQ